METKEKTIVYWGYLSCQQKILSTKCGINERRATTLTHLFLFALLLTQSGDVEKNPGPIETIETVYGICSKNCANLKFVHLNFQSIIRKRMQLKKFLDDMGENTIIGISETWLKKEDSDNLWNFQPRTHAMFRYDRQSAVKKKGGGVLLYIPVKLAPKLRPDLNLFDKEKYESVWVECKSTFNISSKEKMLVNLCYNPSRSNFIDFLEQLTLNIDNAFSVSNKITLLGDYNINNLDSKEKENLDSIIIPYGLKVFCPNDETRISSSTKTHIDYIISDYETNGIEFCFDTPYKTDHFASFILTDIKCGKILPRIITTFNKKNYQKNEFCNSLSALPWYLLYQCTDAQNMFSTMIYLISCALQQHAPIEKKFVRNFKPKNVLKTEWFDSECQQLLTKKQNSLRSYRSQSTSDNWSKYQFLRNQMSKLIRSKQFDHSKNCFSLLSTIQQKWKYINQVRGTCSGNHRITVLRNSFSEMITQDKKIANHLNYIFSNLGEFFGAKKPPNYNKSASESASFHFQHITVKQCFDIVRKINVGKPLGPCTVPAWAIIDGQSVIVPHLTFVINTCLDENIFPIELKKANVTPLFKKDDPMDAKNYRPISITCAFSKIFEKILHAQITEHLDKFQIMTPFQFGFRKNISTQDALVYVTESIRNQIDSKKIVHAALLDLSKAFDSISHEVLIEKMLSLGFSNGANALIASFLNKRIQRVNVNGIFSDWIEIKRGVPQGTVLGPLLFNIYVNDIQERLYEGCTLVQYADDCMVFSSSIISEDALNRLQNSLNNLTEFFAENQLNLNASKSEFITFCQKNDSKHVDTDKLVISGHYVAKKSECKYLGIILYSSLSFHAQIKTILQKMAQGIKTIDTIGQQLPTLSLVALLHCLVLSHLDYSAIFLQQINATLMLSLEKQLNWALKRTYFRSNFKSSSLLRISKSFIGIEKRIELKCITYLYQYLTNKKKAFENTLRLPTANYRLNERTKQIIFDKHCSTASLQKSFFHLTSKKWNSLPIILRNLEKSKTEFKKKLKEFYVSELRNNPICTNTNTWRDYRFC